LPLASFVLVFLALLIASLTDLKARIVPNWLTYGMAGLGLLIGILAGVVFGQWGYLVLVVEGGIFALALAWLLHRLGVWAGGDVKLLIGIGLLAPLNPALFYRQGGFLNPFSSPSNGRYSVCRWSSFRSLP